MNAQDPAYQQSFVDWNDSDDEPVSKRDLLRKHMKHMKKASQSVLRRKPSE